MKKIMALFLLVLSFAGCTAKTYTPVINTEFDLNAVYQTGDFSYNCKIVKTNNSVSITPTSSNAAGMTITYDGKSVTFSKDDMTKSIDADTVDKTNPAIVIYEVFNYLESTDDLSVKMIDEAFEYTGKISIGNFVFVQNSNDSFNSISIPSAEISIKFTS